MIYADNAATTKISKEVLNEMLPFLTENYGNSSSLYSLGSRSRKAIEKARKQVAKAINAEPEEIYFTSGATESNNWVINCFKNSTIVISRFEHPSIDVPCNCFAVKGDMNLKYIPIKCSGEINLRWLNLFWNNSVELVSVMAVNNELGTIQPISEIGELCKKHNVLFHTDATQAIGHIPIDVKKMNIDLMSFSGHKFHAPKGVGVLYIRNGIKLDPFILGGMQENNLRAGTENVANIVGIGKAIEIATDKLSEQKELKNKTRILFEKLKEVGGIKLNGDWDNRIAGNLNICIGGVESESFVLQMDIDGICISAGSACHTGSLEPSRSLKAIGLSDKEALSSVRITLDNSITDEEIEEMAGKMKRTIRRMREIL